MRFAIGASLPADHGTTGGGVRYGLADGSPEFVLEEHRVKLAPGLAPSVELYVGRRHSGTCHFAAQPPAERTRRDPETGFVDLHFDADDPGHRRGRPEGWHGLFGAFAYGSSTELEDRVIPKNARAVPPSTAARAAGSGRRAASRSSSRLQA